MYLYIQECYVQLQASAEFWKCKEGVYKHDTVRKSLKTGEFHLFLWKPKDVSSNIVEERQEWPRRRIMYKYIHNRN